MTVANEKETTKKEFVSHSGEAFGSSDHVIIKLLGINSISNFKVIKPPLIRVSVPVWLS